MDFNVYKVFIPLKCRLLLWKMKIFIHDEDVYYGTYNYNIMFIIIQAQRFLVLHIKARPFEGLSIQFASVEFYSL